MTDVAQPDDPLIEKKKKRREMLMAYYGQSSESNFNSAMSVSDPLDIGTCSI